MNFLERLFGIAPDNGTGITEAVFVLVFLVAGAVAAKSCFAESDCLCSISEK